MQGTRDYSPLGTGDRDVGVGGPPCSEDRAAESVTLEHSALASAAVVSVFIVTPT